RRAGERADAERDAGFEERSTAQGLIATGNPDFTHRRPLSVVMDSLPSAYTRSRFRVSLANKEGNSDENNKARFLVVGRGVTGRARLERLGAGGRDAIVPRDARRRARRSANVQLHVRIDRP